MTDKVEPKHDEVNAHAKARHAEAARRNKKLKSWDALEPWEREAKEREALEALRKTAQTPDKERDDD